ncbi:MAG TPA: MFS transporter [Streptosporangiaceae bacterium]|jgi:ENTS family enterobactin (siderophore) exporter
MRIGQVVVDVAPLRQSRDFRWLFAGRFVANAGNAVAVTAANWQVYGLTHSSLAVGMLTLADSVGMIIGLLAGGMLADRYDRRQVLLAVRLPAGALAALMMVNSLLPRPALWPLYTLTLGIGLLSGLSAPAATAVVPALVDEALLPAAVALNSAGSQLGNLAGPAFGGLLIAGPGLPVCYAIDAAAFVVFGLVMLAVRPLPPAVRGQRPGLRALTEGFSFVRRSGVVGGMLLVDTNAMIFGMPTALFPALAAEHFHGGSATFGLLTAAPGLGALIGGATSGWVGRLRRPGVVVIISGMIWGGAITGFGLVHSLWAGLAFLALAGMGDLISEILRNALLQRYTPDQLRGRVSSLYLAQVNTAPALGNVEAGAVAQLFTPVVSVVSGGLACVAGALLLGAAIPALRHATFASPPGTPSGGGPSPAPAESAS